MKALFELLNEVKSNQDWNGFKAVNNRQIFLTKLETNYITFALQENEVEDVLDYLYRLNQIDVPKKNYMMYLTRQVKAQCNNRIITY